MKIKKIKLYNIGPYINKGNEFNFEVTPDKNMILIGGKNGAGKTTLLNAIKLGIFGCYAYGFKSESATYIEILKQILNYSRQKVNNSKFYIEITFTLTEGYEENTYSFKRSWVNKSGKLEEDLVIRKNNKTVKDEEFENIQGRVKAITSPKLIDTMMFDGEKIAEVIKGNNLTEYLREVVVSLFNVDVFDNLENDMNTYLKKQLNNKVLNNDELQLYNLEGELLRLSNSIKDKNDVLKKQLISLSDNNIKLKALKKKFSNLGGLNNEQKDEMLASFSDIDKNRKENMTIFKNFLENEFVFYINKNLLNSVNKQIELEKPVKLLKYLNEIKEHIGASHTSEIESLLIKQVDNDKILHYADTLLEATVINKLDLISEKSAIEYLTILNSFIDSRGMYSHFRAILDKNSSSEELKFILDEILKYTSYKEDIKNSIEDIKSQISQLETEKTLICNEIDVLEKRLHSNNKELKSFDVARKLISVSKAFKSKQLKTKLNEIETLAVSVFEEISRKKNYITKIDINPVTFEVFSYDNEGIKKPLVTLSAGEAQMLMGAIIWSVFKLSGRRAMFTFDTPLARLDEENQYGFVSKIISSISDQVLILSTDREIVGELLEMISDRVVRTYTLDNDETEKKTYIREGYFEKVIA